MTSTVGCIRKLYVKPEVLRFTGQDNSEFLQKLHELDESAEIYSLEDPAELQLDDDCRTIRGGYRYTLSGLIAVCKVLAPGTLHVLSSLAGISTRVTNRDDLIDGAMAVDMFNRLVDFRFPRFRYLRVLRNSRNKTIEELMGSAYQVLENVAFYNRVDELLRRHRPDTSFYAASLVGRRLAAWFRAPSPLFVDTVRGERWPVHYGYYFCNGEGTGVAVRGTLAIFTPAGVCVAPYKEYGRRLSHTGRSFYGRIGKTYEDVVTQTVPVDDIRDGLETAQKTTLGFEADMDSKAFRRQVHVVVRELGQLHISQRLATAVVTRTLNLGAGKVTDLIMTRHKKDLYASRTVFDLLPSLMGVARQLHLSRREVLEQAAFNILIGKSIF